MARSTSPDSKKRQAKRQQLLRKLRNKYRAVLINESTYEERFSFRLSRFNVILLALLLFTLHGLFVLGLIIFTPLKEYIPGYSNQKVKLNAYRAMTTADSLDQALKVRDAYINNLRNVLSGNLPADSATLAVPLSHPPTAADLKPSIADSLLRAKVREEEAFSVHAERGNGVLDHLGLPGLLFFPPMRGIVTSTFNSAEGHYGIDIVTKADEAVKACLDGTVILASWTSDAGYVIQIQHSLDLVSVYKHNAVLLKKVGSQVKAGEAIAIVGNSGEYTTGPHLHFELWSGGKAVDPQTYIAFK
ncbi:MAG: M23 family metallopeptidase [Flavobacteriales bacterium]|jgi:murein DD-endopeptidase MepM/ murein hydrolase activator NlpD|nr:M23 family metallopeptidase [Flavobacteriales bacterium]MBP9160199.1 M23 family metallopeptidase [Flavobacteriales bacterium]MCI1751871.1 M23 family metallopeptidase [Flavobacteriales bacterium]